MDANIKLDYSDVKALKQRITKVKTFLNADFYNMKNNGEDLFGNQDQVVKKKVVNEPVHDAQKQLQRENIVKKFNKKLTSKKMM